MAEDWIEQLRKKTNTKQLEIRKKEAETRSRAQKEENLYLQHKPAMETKIQEIKSYVSEVNEAGGKNISVEQSGENHIRIGYLPGIILTFKGRIVEATFQDFDSANDEITEWKYANKSFPVEDITRERFMSWMKWVAGMGRPPLRLRIKVGHEFVRGAKIALIVLLIISFIIAFLIYLMFYVYKLKI